MATPSFDELLSRAREIGQQNAEAKYPRTGQLAAAGASQFVQNLLSAPVSERRTTSGYLTREGEFQNLDKPYTAGGNVLQTMIDHLVNRGGNPVPAGAVGLSPSEAPAAFLKTLPTQVIDPVTGRTVTQTIGKPALLQQTKKEKTPMQMQKAIPSGFTRVDEVQKLFPELNSMDELNGVSVSEVMNKRANARAEVIAGLRSATPEEAKDLASGDVIQKQISRVRELGEKTKYLGIGPGASIVGNLGQFSPVKELETDPDTVDLYANLNDVMNQIVYLRSGKQINEQEFKRLKDTFPAANLNETAFKTRLDNFEKTFQQVMVAREERIRGAGRRTGGAGPQPKAQLFRASATGKSGSPELQGITDAQRAAMADMKLEE